MAALANISTPSVSHFENGSNDIQLSTALAILSVLGMTDDRVLRFTALDAYYQPDKAAIFFKGYEGDSLILCGISKEALQDHFGLVAAKKPLQVFKANESLILSIAKKKFSLQAFELDGSLLIKTEDI